jgi:hypothetical protein
VYCMRQSSIIYDNNTQCVTDGKRLLGLLLSLPALLRRCLFIVNRSIPSAQQAARVAPLP